MKQLGWVLALIAFLQAGCATRSPFYPVGIYSVRTVAGIDDVADAGFTAIHTDLKPELMDAAQRRGIAVIAAPQGSFTHKIDPARARDAVRRFDSHPALHAWYLVDEPDMHNVAPSAVQEGQRQLKRAGAKKPTLMVLGTGSAAAQYVGIADITALDRYPVNTRPLATFGAHLRAARLAIGTEKPLYAVIQAFNWSAFPRFVSGNPAQLRAPTEAELRCMSYLALIERANGLFYFAYREGAWDMHEQEETWMALRHVVREVREREPLFKARHLWWPSRVKYAKGTSNLNAINEPSISIACVKVEEGNATIGPGVYLVAANTTPRQVTASIRLPDAPTPPVYVVGEGRAQSPDREGFITETFPPYGVHVFGPLRSVDGVRETEPAQRLR